MTLAQIGVAFAAMLGFAFAPPAQGRMLLVPLSSGAAASLPAVAVDGGAKLLGQGPMAGSLVVMADRARLKLSPIRGVIILSAPAFLCGAAAGEGSEA